MASIYDTSATFFEPRYYGDNLRERGAYDGSSMARQHYPYAIMEDKTELHSYASQECDTWWSRLDHKDEYAAQYAEIKRIYTASFIGAYAEKVEARKEEEAQKKAAARREAEKAQGASVEIRSQRQQPDGVRYLVDFFDPARMTQAISFLVSVKDDGVVELEET
jgi:hypothetical protein